MRDINKYSTRLSHKDMKDFSLTILKGKYGGATEIKRAIMLAEDSAMIK